MKNSLKWTCSCACLLFAAFAVAQNTSEKSSKEISNKEVKKPIVFKFEPDFSDKNEQRKEELALTRSIIDTLDVSDRKRLKLLKDLYKNGVSKRLQKAILVENHFEDIED